MSRFVLVVSLVAALPLVACRSSEQPSTEIARARSGELEVVLLSPGPALRQGKDSSVMEFKRSGQLVDVGTVNADVSMPMPGMAPMLGSVEIRPSSTPGRYTVMTHLTMAGEWRLHLEWNGPIGQGSANFSPKVQ